MNVGMTIVFNGEPTIRLCLLNAANALDKLIVVEGCTVKNSGLSDDGHSTDGTLDILHDLKSMLGDRMVVVSITGYWENKLAMCKAAEPYFESGYLWQIDADEFYHVEAMRNLLADLPGMPVDHVDFWGYHFFGDTGWHMPVKDGVWGNRPAWRRVFSVNPGDHWDSHAPPRIRRNQPSTRTLSRDVTSDMGIMLYHYGYISRPHVARKMIEHGGEACIMRQFEKAVIGKHEDVRIDGYHLERFTGKHPVNVDEFGI